MQKAKRGRPKGATTKPREPVCFVPARCPSCQSTLRDPFREKPYKEMEEGGIAPDQQPYTHIVWRRTRCGGCGQWLTIRSYENRSGENPEKK